MKKCLLLFFLTFFMFGCSNKNIYSDSSEEYCRQINDLICDMDFFTAEVEDNSIILYSYDKDIISKIPFNHENPDANILYIRKENNVVYFVQSTAVDDEYGIMFINDAANNVLDGVKKAERIGGNSYKYSSMY